MKILIVDPDPVTESIFKDAFNSDESEVVICRSGREAIRLYESFDPDIIVLEVDLDDTSGIELCSDLQSLKKQSQTIVFYSNKVEEYIQIVSLDSGADDFILKNKKPFYLRSKLKALHRKGQDPEESKFEIRPDAFAVIKDGDSIYLPKKEFEIFQILFSKPGYIFPRQQIINSLWNKDENQGRVLDVYIRHLREKLGDGFIKTVKGVGYGFIP